MNQLTFIDFFSGIGGFRLGLEKAGMKCVGFCEKDKFAVKSYRAMYDTEGEWYGEDITEIRSEDIPRADIWTAGSPCQNVSITGRRAGIHGDRSSLFFKFTELLKGKAEEDKPEWIILENVRGLLSSNKGWDFLEYLAEMDECGYDLQWQIFNSADYGVPQHRERVYTVGHLRRCGRREILPICGENTATDIKVIGDIDKKGWTDSMRRVYSEDGSAPCLNTCSGGNLQPKVVSRQGYRVYDTEGSSQTLTGNSGGIAGKTGLYLVGYNRNDGITGLKENAGTISASDYRGLNRNQTQTAVLETDKIFIDQSITEPKLTDTARCITARYTAGMTKRTALNSAVMETKDAEEQHFKIRNCTKQGYDKAKVGDGVTLSYPNSTTKRGRVGHGVSQTLTVNGQHGAVVKDGKEIRIRRLTPRECFRLQGFPDDLFEKARAVNSDAQLYKQAGNAVTVNVVYAIGKKIAESVL